MVETKSTAVYLQAGDLWELGPCEDGWVPSINRLMIDKASDMLQDQLHDLVGPQCRDWDPDAWVEVPITDLHWDALINRSLEDERGTPIHSSVIAIELMRRIEDGDLSRVPPAQALTYKPFHKLLALVLSGMTTRISEAEQPNRHQGAYARRYEELARVA